MSDSLPRKQGMGIHQILMYIRSIYFHVVLIALDLVPSWSVYHLREFGLGVSSVLNRFVKMLHDWAMSDADKNSVSDIFWKFDLVVTRIIPLFLLVYNRKLSKNYTLIMDYKHGISQALMTLIDGWGG